MRRKQRGNETTRQKSSSQKTSRNTHFRGFILLCVVLLFALLDGCGGGSPSSSIPNKVTPPAPAKKKSELPNTVEKTEQKKEEGIEYSYNPVGKPDPFKPFIQVSSGKEFSKSATLSPLQKYDMSQIKLVAVIVSAEGNIALVEDSLGKGYFLKKGTQVGRNDGKVKRILKDRVIVEEVDEDSSGQRKAKEISLILHQLEEGGES